LGERGELRDTLMEKDFAAVDGRHPELACV
jgi:hypothetical protein